MARLNADVQAIADNGGKRYEDALISDALRYFIGFAGDIPAFAWGRMEWSSRWASDWSSAVNCRIQEAGIARDVQAETGATLYAVAANYAHTDIHSAVDLSDVASQYDFLQPWLAGTATTGPVLVHPGGTPAGPTFFSGTFTPNLTPADISDPSDLKARVTLAQQDHILGGSWMEAAGTVSLTDKANMILGNTPGRHALWDFVNQHGGDLSQAEQIVEQLGLASGKMPMQDFINEALGAFPGIIINRAELINAVSGEWAERSADMSSQTTGLQAYWDSPGGAAAYLNHANRCIHYYDTLQAQAAWLGSEGKRAGSAIDGLQLAYAKVGYDQIGNLITKLKAYLDAADSFTGSIEEPSKALAAALSAMGSAMLADWEEANNNASATLQINQVAHDEAPDLGDATHRTQPFPSESGAPPYGNAGDWHPNPAGPPGVAGS